MFFGVMVLFFRLIVFLLFKMHTPKQDFEKLKFSSFDLQNNLLNNNNDWMKTFLKQISLLTQIISQWKRLNQNFLAAMISFFQYFIWI